MKRLAKKKPQKGKDTTGEERNDTVGFVRGECSYDNVVLGFNLKIL